jgi:hypothetical protein
MLASAIKVYPRSLQKYRQDFMLVSAIKVYLARPKSIDRISGFTGFYVGFCNKDLSRSPQKY